MGDTISHISNAVVVNRSTVGTIISRLPEGEQANTEAAFEKIASEIARAGNPEAKDLFDQLTEELAKEKPRKNLAKRSWEGLLDALPSIATLAGVADKIARLFT